MTWEASKRTCDMVDLAISAVALAIFSRTQQHPPAAREAYLRYGRLLRVAQEQITQVEILNCDENGFDKLLLTIVLMAWYETAMHQPANLKLKNLPSSQHSWSHHDGAMAILTVWNDRGHAPSSIIKQSRRGLLRSALLRNRSLPGWMRDGSRFGEHGLDFGFDGILVRVVSLRRAFKNLKQSKHLETAEAEYLNTEARDLDEACRAWTVRIPSEWSYEVHKIPSSSPSRDFYSSTVYTCARHGYAAVWIQYFALRILINSTLLGLLEISCPPQLQAHDSTYQAQHRESITQIKAMADSLASTIPFSLGQFKADKAEASDSRPTLTLNADEEIPPALALPTVWPLSTASSVDGIETGQQLWFRAQLALLGRVLGDGALECAGTDHWTHD
jgi:hypothetical protein